MPDDACSLFDEAQRLSVYPIKHHDLWSMYKKQVACFWTAEEIDFSKDREQWVTLLNDDERHFVKNILAFFATSDSVVSLNLMDRFTRDVPVLEAQICYTFQASVENIHAEVYSMMIDTYITEAAEKDALLRGTVDSGVARDKIRWAMRFWKQTTFGDDEGDSAAKARDWARRLAAYAIVEGLFFSGCFCAIYWLKQRNLLPGLTKSNEFIARDEAMHTDFGCTLYCKLGPETRLSKDDMYSMMDEALKIETHFIVDSLPCRLIGMNSDAMTEYVRHVADNVLKRLGYPPRYHAVNPFPFMELIGLIGRSNFFEERVSQYQRAPQVNDEDVGTFTDKF